MLLSTTSDNAAATEARNNNNNNESLIRYFIKSTKYNFPHNEIIIPPHEMEIMIKRNVKLNSFFVNNEPVNSQEGKLINGFKINVKTRWRSSESSSDKIEQR